MLELQLLTLAVFRFLHSTAQPATAELTQIRVGFMFPQNISQSYTFERSAGAVGLALDRVAAERLLPDGVNITVEWKFEDCDPAQAAGGAYELLGRERDPVHALISSPCNDGALIEGHLATYFNLPLIVWGAAFSSELIDGALYPAVLTVVPNYAGYATALCDVVRFYEWSGFSFIYQQEDNGGCFELQREVDAISFSRSDCVIAFKDEYKRNSTLTDQEFTIKQIEERSRIVVLCFDNTTDLRQFALSLFDHGLNRSEFVFLHFDSDISMAIGRDEQPFWVGDGKDGRDGDAKAIGDLSLLLGFQLDETALADAKLQRKRETFPTDAAKRAGGWPFFCAECDPNRNASSYSRFLYDAVYAYFLALSTIRNSTGEPLSSFISNGTFVAANANVDFEGMTGPVNIGEDGIRDSTYILQQYNSKKELVTYLLIPIVDAGTNVSVLYSNASTSIWASRGGVKPLAVPLCGFDGLGCPVDFFTANRAAVIGGSAGVAVPKRTESAPSMSSKSFTGTISTRLTFESATESKNFHLYRFRKDTVIGWKHARMPAHLSTVLMEQLRTVGFFPATSSQLFVQMQALNHDNLNNFYGIASDPSITLSVWKYCARGSLADLVMGNALSKDAVLVSTIIKDIAEGLHYLHQSQVGFHGSLRSAYCLIDDRWKAKISYFGLDEFRAGSGVKSKNLLWTAPELLRETPALNAQAKRQADVYSFAIICSELVNMRPAWEPLSEERGINADEIVYQVKSRAFSDEPFRPAFDPAVDDLNPALLLLVRDCWNEEPTKRPKSSTIRSLLRAMNNGRDLNLLDHVFSKLEKYSDELQEEIADRTRELLEEKRRSDLLLYRMLPPQIANLLKAGQAIPPESFESATIFFSDLVSFTQLSARCSPMQVVGLLNELYTSFDNLIAEHDVHKTIGRLLFVVLSSNLTVLCDGYMACSGLPNRNGSNHAKEIAELSLRLLDAVRDFHSVYLPAGSRLSIRIGCHSGPCVAGVVGLSMPRYCLFGDTVNTASRMESSGKADHIQITKETNHLLVNVLGGFVTECRGETIVKGKGVMVTYFLLRKGTPIQRPKSHSLQRSVSQELPID
ncbi:Guanylate cyclase [Aphelenchoides fujianensis]|nr:Guanylate cyclase [Aphelenchoides fujianensis]